MASGEVKEKMKNMSLPSVLFPVAEGTAFVWFEWRKQKLPLAIFILLCINLVIAPAVYAASNGALERNHAYALGILGLVTLGLVVYLFVVVFQPERF